MSFEINKPFGFVPDEETEKLRRAAAAFNAKIRPEPKESEVPLREVARDAIDFYARHRELTRGRFTF